jgi:hypothetical protein
MIGRRSHHEPEAGGFGLLRRAPSAGLAAMQGRHFNCSSRRWSSHRMTRSPCRSRLGATGWAPAITSRGDKMKSRHRRAGRGRAWRCSTAATRWRRPCRRLHACPRPHDRSRPGRAGARARRRLGLGVGTRRLDRGPSGQCRGRDRTLPDRLRARAGRSAELPVLRRDRGGEVSRRPLWRIDPLVQARAGRESGGDVDQTTSSRRPMCWQVAWQRRGRASPPSRQSIRTDDRGYQVWSGLPWSPLYLDRVAEGLESAGMRPFISKRCHGSMKSPSPLRG